MAAAPRSRHSGKPQLRICRGKPFLAFAELRGEPVDIAQPDHVLAMELDRVDPQLVRDLVHQRFLREETLRASVAAERARHRRVGVDHVAFEPHVAACGKAAAPCCPYCPARCWRGCRRRRWWRAPSSGWPSACRRASRPSSCAESADAGCAPCRTLLRACIRSSPAGAWPAPARRRCLPAASPACRRIRRRCAA